MQGKYLMRRRNKLCGIICMIGIITVCSLNARAQYRVDETDPGRQTDFQWPEGIHMALSLSFDDARYSQIDHGVPLLDTYDVKATFYVTPRRVKERVSQWKQAAANGHEIGNHTLTHPCTGNYFAFRTNALEEYTLNEIEYEMLEANAVIERLLGYRMQTFAYPCGQSFVGRGENVQSYVPLVAKHFLAGRGWLGENSNDPAFCDPALLLGMECDGLSFDEMKQLLDTASKNGRWLILAGHEIGAPGRQVTIDTELEKLCQYVTDPSNGIWTATIREVAEYVLKQRTGNDN